MTTTEAKKILEDNKHRNAAFFSDPESGDHIIITDGHWFHTNGQSDTAENLLLTLDFEVYDGNGPTVTVLAS